MELRIDHAMGYDTLETGEWDFKFEIAVSIDSQCSCDSYYRSFPIDKSQARELISELTDFVEKQDD